MSENGLKICICGGGTMGSGIAQAAVMAHFDTILYDVNEDVIQQARSKIESGLLTLVSKEKITAKEKEAAMNRLFFTTDIYHCKAHLIIEAIIEDETKKITLFQHLAQYNTADTVYASNTSSLSLNKIAASLPFNDRVLGMHFFNPAPIMKLVEIVKTSFVNEASVQMAISVAQQMNKVAVICKDAPGFIVNRVARPFYTEALRLAEEGCPIETIDNLMEAAGFKLGPFRLMDFIGNDINYTASCAVYEALHCPERLKPSPLQKEKVEKGALGKKSGKGFYNY